MYMGAQGGGGGVRSKGVWGLGLRLRTIKASTSALALASPSFDKREKRANFNKSK